MYTLSSCLHKGQQKVKLNVLAHRTKEERASQAWESMGPEVRWKAGNIKQQWVVMAFFILTAIKKQQCHKWSAFLTEYLLCQWRWKAMLLNTLALRKGPSNRADYCRIACVKCTGLVVHLFSVDGLVHRTFQQTKVFVRSFWTASLSLYVSVLSCKGEVCNCCANCVNKLNWKCQNCYWSDKQFPP